MSLQAAAQHLSSQGRGPDDMLIHMSKGEVKSLNDLAMAHGGHLTINPSTGLPEAGFLKKLLPAIIGAGLTIATGGAAAPWMIGLGVGGVETLRTGDIRKGLMAGLGAYGGAGIGAGISSAGNAAVSEAVSAANPGVVGPMPGAASGLEAAKAGVSSLGTEAGRATALGAMGGGYGALSKAGMALAPVMQADPAKEEPVDNTPAPPLTYDYNPTMPMPAPDVPKYGDLGQDFGRQQRYFPDAGYKASTKAERGFAMGGLSDLGGYSDGGRLLRGPGDGVSDSIPAMIGKKQPARLADGEFVVPARIVSELGNGSTEAGARKLYAMMDRVQKARGSTVGKGRVAKNSRSERFLPA